MTTFRWLTALNQDVPHIESWLVLLWIIDILRGDICPSPNSPGPSFNHLWFVLLDCPYAIVRIPPPPKALHRAPVHPTSGSLIPSTHPVVLETCRATSIWPPTDVDLGGWESRRKSLSRRGGPFQSLRGTIVSTDPRGGSSLASFLSKRYSMHRRAY